jgi:hypothetical protein
VVLALSDDSSPKEQSGGSAASSRAKQSDRADPSAQTWLDTHSEALRLRSEIELLELEAESKIAEIRRALRADLVEKEEQLANLRARVDILQVQERRRDDVWSDDDYPERRPAEYTYGSSRSRRPPARRQRRRPVARTVGSSRDSRDSSPDTSDRVLDEVSRLLRGVGEVLAEQAHTAADASSYVADSLQRRGGDRGTSRELSDGISDAIDRIIDMPGAVVSRVHNVYSDSDWR